MHTPQWSESSDPLAWPCFPHLCPNSPPRHNPKILFLEGMDPTHISTLPTTAPSMLPGTE